MAAQRGTPPVAGSAQRQTPANRAQQPQGGEINSSLSAQLQAMIQQKKARTPAQRKIESRILYTIKMRRGEPIAAGVPTLQTDIQVGADGKLQVDIAAAVTDDLLGQIRNAGGEVLSSFPQYNTVRASVPLTQIESLAALPAIKFIRRAAEARLHGKSASDGRLAGFDGVAERDRQRTIAPLRQRRSFAERAAQVQAQLRAVLATQAQAGPQRPVQPNVGSLTSQGDLTHQASNGRAIFNVDGTGVKIGVLSDSVDHLAASQASGDLGTVTVLPGQSGVGACGGPCTGEGTAMLEIIHDLAPGAQLFFATAFGGQAMFAQNIRDLRTAGCDIIVDDVIYFAETPFQDGQTMPGISPTLGGVIAQAVNDVTAAGALYFSSAGNDGNLNDNTARVWEGDFVAGPEIFIEPEKGDPILAGISHTYGATFLNRVPGAVPNEGLAFLFWSDALGASANDYDLYLVSSAGNSILDASDNSQTGTEDPIEIIGGISMGEQLLIVLDSGSPRYLRLEMYDALLTFRTAGRTKGHSSALNAYSVAATRAVGPFPNPFNPANVVETFSSDGPRHLFYNANGTAITPGNFLASGGMNRQKPDITAADGVATATPGFNPFFGTSAAAPHAAAIAGLLKSAVPSLTPAQIRSTLMSTAIDIEAAGVDRDSGAGIVMALAALQAVAPGVQLASVPASQTVTQGQSANYTINLTRFNFTGAVTLSVSNLPAGATSSFTPNPAAGNSSTLMINTDGSTATGTFTPTVSATASGVTITPLNISLTVNAPNTPPIITPVATSRQAGSPVSNSTIATVSDGQTAPGALTVNVNGGASATVNNITVSNLINTGGTVTANVVAACNATPGVTNFTINVSDGSLTTPGTLAVTVNANSSPTLSYNNQSAAAGGVLNINPATGLSDNGTINSIVVQSQGSYTGTISVNGSGVVSISGAKPGGLHTITIRATDNCGLFTDATFTLMVNCPTISLSPPTLPGGTAGTSYNQTITPSGGASPYTFSFTGTLPNGLTLSPGPAATATLSGTPALANTFNFTVQATDANGCTGTQAYSITINPANVPPAINAVAVSRQQGSPVSNSAIANVTDPDQALNTLTVTVNGGASATVNGVMVSGISVSALGLVTANVIAACAATTANFTLTVTDNASASNNATLTVTVTANSAPVLTYINQSVAAGGSINITPATGLSDNGSVSTVVVQSQGGYTGTISVNGSGVVSISGAKPGGVHTITIRATDNCGMVTDASFTLTINCPVINLSPLTLPGGTVGTGYNQTITPSGGTSPYTFSFTGTLPNGLSLSAGPSATAALSGTPAVANTFNFAVTATDANGCPGVQAYSVTINPANVPPAINAVAVSRQQGSPVSNSTIANVTDPDQALNTLTVTVNSGASATVNGVTVSGISVSALGVVTANVIADCTAAAASFTLTVTDNATASNNALLTVTVTANTQPVLTYGPQSVAAGGSINISPVTGLTDNGSVSTVVVQNQGSYTGTISVNSSGMVSISGAKPGGIHTITIRATDNCGLFTDASFTLTVNCPAISLSPPTLPGGTVGTVYNQTITTSGGGSPYTFSFTGTLPNGLALSAGPSATATLSGTPTLANTFNFTVQATDANGCTGTQAYSITINPANVPPAITPVAVSRQQGSPVSNSTVANVTDPDQALNTLTVTVNGGTSATVNGVTVSGIGVSALGVVTGNVVAGCGATTANFTLTVTDSATASNNATLTVTVTANTAPALTYGNQSVAAGDALNINPAAGLSDNGTINTVVVQNQGGYTGTISVNASGVVSISGAKPGGLHTITIRATDNCELFTDATFTLTVTCPTISLTPATLPNGMAGAPYNQSLTASNGAPPYTFGITGGALPSGMGLSSGGVLSGAPATFGAFNFTAEATDANGCMGTQNYTLTINPPCGAITIAPATLPSGFAGTAYNQTLTASGGAAPYTFAISAGTLPNGVNLSAGGALSGTPAAAGTFTFTVKATDHNACMGTQDYSVIVSGNGLQFFPLPTPVRLLDTRTGFPGCTTGTGPLTANSTRTQPALTVCSTIPANATAVTGNITVVPTGAGFLTLFPGTATQPTVANSNFGAGEITNNVFTVGLGDSGPDAGAFKIFSSATTEVIIDVTGYYAPPTTAGLYFHPLPTPVRLLETRIGFSGCFAPGTPLAGTGNPNADPGLDLAVQGRTPLPCTAPIPASAQVLVGNATTVFPSGGGYLTIYPSGGTRPTVASSNYAGGDVINGPFAVKLGADGKFKIYTFATTHVVVDILGYYSEDAVDVNGSGLLFNPLPAPVRLLETRPDFPGFPLTGCTRTNAKIQGNLASATHTQSAGGFCGLPATAQAVVGNVSVVNSEGAGFLTLFPGNLTTAPLVATSNYPQPATFGYNRHYFVGLSPVNGTFKVLTQFTTDLILDASGYFAP